MKTLLGDMASGKIGIYEVPEPELSPGGILVRTCFSAISAGTECAQMETASRSLIGKALARPDLARQVLDYARTQGWGAAYGKLRSRLDTLTPLGYSCSGVVMGVGAGVRDFNRGDRVACAGAGYASHAEINWIPQNLAVRVPDNVPMEAAALSTLGAIAMQGLRQSGAALGETVVVIGAGLVGVLTIQLARAAGCRVIAIDLDPERARDAVQFGAHLGLATSDPRLEETVTAFSRYGADAAIISAETRSSEPVERASRILRDRGRIVIVGTVSIDVPRAALYRKELSLVMSRSYGPGRYDPAYEEEGQDYPVGYVRWTEQRNLEAFLDALSSGSVDVSRLLQKRCPIERAPEALDDLRTGQSYTTILEYPQAEATIPAVKPRLVLAAARAGEVRLGCIGAGAFAREHMLPNLRAQHGVRLLCVATATGVAAEAARRKYGFARASTASEIFENSDVNAVFVLSRNRTHAEYVVRALQCGKLVFVEKPLAVTREQLQEIQLAYERASQPFLMVGFNRRFAPATEALQDFFVGRREPMMVNIRVNAGYLPREHWTQHADEGGRIIGELCHFVDWARLVIGQPIRSVSAAALPDAGRYSSDNLTAALSFADGSLANLVYLANGDRALPKEYYEVFCQGMVARLDNFRVLELFSKGKSRRMKFTQDKGHGREVRRVLDCMESGEDCPIPFQEIIEITEATFRIDEAIRVGESMLVREQRVSNHA
jgi:polar amino acid transport system substrate-binding protein